jgi:tetratricopeptide (TPR) repeat protein
MDVRLGGLVGVVLLMTAPVTGGWLTSENLGRRGPAVLGMDPTVRSRSLGGAHAGLADDAGALYWNPAGLQRTQRSEITLGRGSLNSDQTHDAAIFVRPFWRAGDRETWAVGLSHLADEAFELKEEGQNLGTAKPTESVVTLGYARPWAGKSLGVTGKYVRQESFQESGSTYALDAGIQNGGDRIRWGVSLANLGPAMKLGSTEMDLPLVFRLGGAVVVEKSAARRWVGTAQMDVPADDEAVFRLGMEYGLVLGAEWRAALRAGYVSAGESGLSAGAGVERGSVGINYVFIPAGDLGTSNRLELCWRFGSPLAQQTRREALLAEARSALAAGRLTDAETVLETAKTISPRSPEVARLQQSVAVRFSESLDPGELLEQGRRLLEKGDLDGAEVSFRKVLLVRPENAEAKEGIKKAAAAAAARRDQQAQRAIAQAKARERQGLFDKAREAMKRNEWVMALAQWEKVSDLFPSNDEAKKGAADCREVLYQTARSAQRAGRVEEARTFYRACQDGRSTYRDSAAQLKAMAESENKVRQGQAKESYEAGRAAYRAGDVMKARDLFEKAVRLAPDDSTYKRAFERAQQELRTR